MRQRHTADQIEAQVAKSGPAGPLFAARLVGVRRCGGGGLGIDDD